MAHFVNEDEHTEDNDEDDDISYGFHGHQRLLG
jgi:hypothetical protein